MSGLPWARVAEAPASIKTDSNRRGMSVMVGGETADVDAYTFVPVRSHNARMWTGFSPLTLQRDGVTLFARQGGPRQSGRPPLLLLHGHPQSMAMWHRVAPALAQDRQVVLMDLRGYGDSDRPPAGEGSAAYAKREMALDALAVMQSLGHERFAVLAHDRGARAAHRLALDHPQAVTRLMLLDIAPTLAMYEGTTEAFARAYWHWFFLIQPAPQPER